ncbi:MAG: hypothetical protein FMNOHCHN_03752 [Ignavibacteriaceae bacterium]|nr:hypothetical protein [Ignavibacteriaceae bacterium]
MRRSFTLKVKPFSVNAMYYGDKRVKTSEARNWSYNIFHNLNNVEVQQYLTELRSFFNPDLHVYNLHLVAYYPSHVFTTKDGRISGKTMDVTNWEKPLVDLLFLPKYFSEPPPYGCHNLNVDDRFLTKVLSEKRQSPDDNYYIHIAIKVSKKPQPS